MQSTHSNVKWVFLQIMQLLGLFFQICAEIGVCNADQLLGPLSDCLSVQVSNPVFSHHIAYVVTAGDYSSPKLQHAGYPGDRRSIAQDRCARQRNDRYAAL